MGNRVERINNNGEMDELKGIEFVSMFATKETERLTNKRLPHTYKYGRDAVIQLHYNEKELLANIEEEEKKIIEAQKKQNIEIQNEEGKKIERKITPYDFEAFCVAMAQILFNQSYESGYTENYSGLEEEIAEQITNTSKSGKTYYLGFIKATLNDICRLGYGQEPNPIQKETISTLIKILHKTKVHIVHPNGDEQNAVLCACLDEYTRIEDGAKIYQLVLNPIFCSRVKENFGELPQNAMSKLSKVVKRKTTAHIKLLKLLGMQDKRKPFIRTIEQLLIDLCLEETYKKQPSRTEKMIIKIFEDFKKAEQISNYELEERTTAKRTSIDKVIIHLNSTSRKDNIIKLKE